MVGGRWNQVGNVFHFFFNREPSATAVQEVTILLARAISGLPINTDTG
jgi:hypothetical protein